jgi:uncharacterized protein (UPF0248 family)
LNVFADSCSPIELTGKVMVSIESTYIYFHRIPCHRVVYGWQGGRTGTVASYEKG